MRTAMQKSQCREQADQGRSKQIKYWKFDDGDDDDDDDDDGGPKWPPVNLANSSFDGALSGSPQ